MPIPFRVARRHHHGQQGKSRCAMPTPPRTATPRPFRLLNKSQRTRADQVTAALSLPTGAVIYETTEAGREIADLGATFRPLLGGSQFGYVLPNGARNWCSLGIPVIRNGVQGFLTASHCTTWRNTPDGGAVFQAWASGSPIGTEIFDRSGSTCGAFNIRNCRHADVAMNGIQTLDVPPGGTGFVAGRIARTVAPTAGVGNGFGSREVTSHWDARWNV
jgi:hypothetical protein